VVEDMIRKKWLILIIIFMVIFFASTKSYADNFFDKLKRGVVNTLTGWLEIPKKIIETSREETLFKGLTVGLAKGIGRGVARTAVGLCETTTFMAPIPKKDYEPIMIPEHVFKKEDKDKDKEKEKTK
jgi:putative exosortase-associated protein (TIGR04073 family)